MSDLTVEGTEHQETYEIEPSGTVRISVSVGDGNTGGILVTLAGEDLKLGNDTLDDVNVGESPAIDGEDLVVFTSVSHVNPQSLRTSVSHTLSGGRRSRRVVLKAAAQQPGDVIEYRATFRLRGA